MNTQKISFENALHRLMELCSRVEKSPYEIEKKLATWGVYEYREQILKALLEEKFIDPSRFAIAFARDKAKINKWGKNKIRFLLKGHQIESSTIESALAQIDDENYTTMVLEELDKKYKTIKSGHPLQRKSKLYAFANQRGYEQEYINRFLNSKGY